MATSQSSALPFPDYFSAMAANYAKSTGDSTRRIFEESFDYIQAAAPIESGSVIHDNAAGPGVATSVVVDKLARNNLPDILITDNVPPMINAAKDSFGRWPQIQARVVDSLQLDVVPDDHFTHSILNFSIFTFSDPSKAMREIYRTLQPGGLAALLTWKRFGAGEVVHAAQALVRPDLPPMAVPHPEFAKEGFLQQSAADAGFSSDKIQYTERQTVVSGPELEQGLRGFLLSDFTLPARRGWTEEEVARWPQAVDEVIQQEVKNFGGVRFEAWVVLAKK